MAANLLGQCVAGIPCRSLVKRLLSAVPSCTQSTPPQETYANHILDDEEFEDDTGVYETLVIVLALLVVLLIVALVAVVKRTRNRVTNPTVGNPNPPDDDFMSCASELAQVALTSVIRKKLFFL